MREYAEALWGVWSAQDGSDLDVSGHEIIELDGVAVGCVATDWKGDHLFIDKLYIAPSFQRNGIGASVLGTIVSQAAKRGVPTMLSVLTTNPADWFYRREGFELMSETTERRLFVKAG